MKPPLVSLVPPLSVWLLVFFNPAPAVAAGSLGGKVSVSVSLGTTGAPGHEWQVQLPVLLPQGWDLPVPCQCGGECESALWGCAGTCTVTLTHSLCKLLAVPCVSIAYKYFKFSLSLQFLLPREQQLPVALETQSAAVNQLV